MKKLFFLCWAVLVISLANTVGYAQQSQQQKYWFSVGLGKTQFPSGMIAIGYEFVNKPTVLTARYTDSRELFPDYSPSIMTQEIALLYGLRAGKFRFSTGISNVWGRDRGQYLFTDSKPFLNAAEVHESIRYSTVGLPAEIRFITSLKSVGIGLTAFGNLNAKRSFAGLNLSLYVGKMK
ncbi:MAG: hypothetical protein EOO61_23465 [Hymenobacter sp.]|nr:MAG: hypothetical protein EOO61_23465 [Hymenobacter sp.]